MKKFKINRITKMISEGRIECLTDLRIGYVEIRYISSGKRTTIEVTY